MTDAPNSTEGALINSAVLAWIGKAEVGDRVTLHGEVRYLQDFGGWRREFPEDLVWTVDNVKDNGVSLRAPGYGVLKGAPGDYGNGGIHVRHQTFVKHARRVEP